jgi:hypothetical protein
VNARPSKCPRESSPAHHAGLRCKRLALLCWFSLAGACSTVDLGDHFEATEISVDENFFHCEVQPKVITEYRCAGGGSGESGSCHMARSALRLVEVQEEPRCRDGRVIGAAPDGSLVNLERVRATLGVDAEASPFYRRPLALDSHPRAIFEPDSEPARLIRSWLDQGAP